MEWNEPSRSDYYLMRIHAALVKANVLRPIKFDLFPGQPDKEQETYQKDMILGMFGFGKNNQGEIVKVRDLPVKRPKPPEPGEKDEREEPRRPRKWQQPKNSNPS